MLTCQLKKPSEVYQIYEILSMTEPKFTSSGRNFLPTEADKRQPDGHGLRKFSVNSLRVLSAGPYFR